MNVICMIDTSALEAHLLRLAAVAREETLPFIAEKNKERILRLTAEGRSFDGEEFHPYNPKYALVREKAGKVTDIKNLFFDGTMLSSLAYTPESPLSGILTVGEDEAAKALGQQTGHSGEWGYEHQFIGVSDEGHEEALTAWNEVLVGRLRG